MAKVGTNKANETTALATVKPTMHDNLPAHLRDGESTSMSLLRQYIVPPRAKVVQRQALAPIKDMFRPGDVIVMPEMTMLSPVIIGENSRETDQGKPFHGVVLFFYPEFIAWNPVEAKAILPSIRERSTDPKSDVARRAKNENTRTMICPEMKENSKKEPLYVKFVEHLNFVVSLVGESAIPGMDYLTMSFARGEYKYGQSLAGLITARNAKHVYGCQFEFAVGPRKKNENEWLGINSSNPSQASGVDPWVQDLERFNFYKNMHEVLAKAYLEGLLQTDVDTPGDSATVEGQATESKY